jgi:hypothetical protein
VDGTRQREEGRMNAYNDRNGSEVVKTRLVRIQARALALTILVF